MYCTSASEVGVCVAGGGVAAVFESRDPESEPQPTAEMPSIKKQAPTQYQVRVLVLKSCFLVLPFGLILDPSIRGSSLRAVLSSVPHWSSAGRARRTSHLSCDR